MQEGRQAGEAGNWGSAVYYFSQAEQLDPKSRRIRNLKAAAEQKISQQSSQAAGKASVVALGLANANQALAAQSWEAAQTAATTVLGIDPENAEARAILTKAQDGAARSKARQQRRAQTAAQPTPGEVAPLTTPATSVQPVRPAAPAARPEATTATLRIHVTADMEGSVIVSIVGHQELLRHNFERGGLFSRNKPETEISLAKEVPAGAGTLRIIVAPKGHKGEVTTKDMNFQGGSSHRLEIHLLSSAESTIQLN